MKTGLPSRKEVAMLNALCRPHRAHLKAETAEAQKLFAILKLTPKAEVAGSRPRLAVALVIDTSGSMLHYVDQRRAREAVQANGLAGRPEALDRGRFRSVRLDLPSKLAQAVAAARALVDDERLTAEDRVTVCHFDDEAEVPLHLAPLADRRAARDALAALRASTGETRLAKGLSCALREIRHLPPETAKRVVVLTDGRTLDEEECRLLAKQFAQANAPLVAIGIGGEYNEELLLELAQASQGRPYHLQEMAQLRAILNLEVGAAVREVVTDLQLNVVPVRGVALDSVTRVYPSLAEVDLEETPCRLGNVATGDYTVYVLEFTIAGIERPESRAQLAHLSLEGFVPALDRREPFFAPPLAVTFTTDPDLISSVDPEVMGYVWQRNLDRMVQEAMRRAASDPAGTRQGLEEALAIAERVDNPAVVRMIRGALDELERTGSLSAERRKTVLLGGRTKTIRAEAFLAGEDVAELAEAS
jgi:Ca-activated chloride channel family protein